MVDFGTGDAAYELSAVVNADVSSFQSSLTDATSTLGDFKKQIGLAGGAVAALGTKAMADAVSSAREFESQMNDVAKVTDPSVAEEMSDAVREMSETMPLATDELSSTAATAARLGVEGKDNLQEFTEQASQLGVATDLSANEAADAMARMSTLMEEPVEDIRFLGSAVNELGNTMATSQSEITDAATRSAAELTSLGLTSEDVLSLNAAMNEVSPSARKAGTNLRTLAESLMDPKKISGVAEALDMTEDEFRNMIENDPTGTIEMLAKTMDDGGSEAEALRQVLGKQASTLNSLGSNWDAVEEAQSTANTQMEEGTSLQNEFEKATSTVDSRVQTFKNRIHSLAIGVGQNLMPPLSRLLNVANDAITRFSALDKRTDGWASTLTLLGVTLGGAVTAVGSFISVLGTSATASAAASGAIGSLGTAISLLTGPVGIAVAAIAGLAYAWDRDLGSIQSKTRKVTSRLEALFQQHIGPIRTEVEELASTARGTLLPAFDAVRGWVQSNMPLIRSITDGALTTVADLIMGVADAALRMTRILLNVINGDYAEAWSMAKSLVSDTVRGIRDWLTGTGATLVRDAFRLLADGVLAVGGWLKDQLIGSGGGGGLIGTMIGSIATFIAGLGMEDVKAAFRALGSGIRTVALTFFNLGGKIGEVIVDFIGAVATYLTTQAWTDLKAAAGFAFDALKTAALASVRAITPPDGIIAQLVGDIVNYLTTQAWSDLKAAGEFLFDALMAAAKGFANGLLYGSLIPNLFSDLSAYIRGPALQQVVGATRQLLERTFQAWVNVNQRILNFYQEIGQRILSTAQSLGQQFLGVTRDVLQSAFQTWVNLNQRIFNFYKEITLRILSAAQSFGSNLLSWLGSTAESFLSTWQSFLGTAHTAIARTFSSIHSWVTEWESRFGSLIFTILSNAWDTFRSALATIAQGLEQTFDNIVSWLEGTWAGDFVGAIFTALDDAYGWFSTLYRKATSKVDDLTSDTLSAAQDWVDDFTQPFERAKDRVLDEFAELKERVVGNSIVPSMLSQTLDETQSWRGDFTGEYGAAASGVESEFGRMHSAASAPTPGAGGATGGAQAGLGDVVQANAGVRSEIANQTGVMADAFGGGGAGGIGGTTVYGHAGEAVGKLQNLSGGDLAEVLSEGVFGQGGHGWTSVMAQAINPAVADRAAEAALQDREKYFGDIGWNSPAEMRQTLQKAFSTGKVFELGDDLGDKVYETLARGGAAHEVLESAATVQNLSSDLRQGIAAVASDPDAYISDFADEDYVSWGIEGARTLESVGRERGPTIVDVQIDARGADNPDAIEDAAKRGIADGLRMGGL